ncbi:hypothetical protein GCM10027180_32170 [Microbulbifer echini]
MSDDWGNKRKYLASEVTNSVQSHYPKLSKYEMYAIYMWSEKKQFDKYCTESNISLTSIEARKEIGSVVISMSNSDSSGLELDSSNDFSGSGGLD